MAVLHHFQCSENHVTEKAVQSAARYSRRRCGFKGCKRLAEHVILPKRFAHAQPTVVFRDKSGKFLFPGRGDHPTPADCDRIEIQPHEIRNFEREINRQMTSEESRKRELDQRSAEHHRSQRHSDLRGVMGQMDAFHRELAHEAMKGESSGYSKPIDPGFHVGAYS